MAATPDVPEVLANVCGVICSNYMIIELADSPVKRDYGVFTGYDHTHPEIVSLILKSFDK
jgi:hypothetical protein